MSDTQLPNIGTVSTTEIESLRIRFAKGGTATGVPVLLTAPWPESIYAFHRLLPYLEKNIPTLPLTFPATGFPIVGRSSCRPQPWAILLFR